MSYRVELSKSNRAKCQATQCKNEGTKIEKNALRQGVLVTMKENTTMKWRHWGCVTPQVFHNWAETSGMDMDLIDGYDELPSDSQAKVKRALEQGHVDDEDWNGDLECNRYTGNKFQGMFVKAPKGKTSKDDDGGNDDGSPSKKPAAKKRGRGKKNEEEGDDTVPVPKKRAKKTVNDNEKGAEPAKSIAKKGVKKGAKTTKGSRQDEDEAQVTSEPHNETNEDETTTVPQKRGKKTAQDKSEAAPVAKRGRKTKGVTANSTKAAEAKPATKRKGRSAAKAASDEEIEEEAPEMDNADASQDSPVEQPAAKPRAARKGRAIRKIPA